MQVVERDKIIAEISELTENIGKTRTALMPILEEIQNRHGWIADYAMQEIASQLDIHPVEVYSVVSFYAFFNEEKKGRFIIRLCRTISCDMAGKDNIARQLEVELGIKFGDTTPDGRFSLEWTNCMGMCDMGPALLVNRQVFTHVSVESVHQILEGCRNVWNLYPEHNESTGHEIPGSYVVPVPAGKES
jgi:NADH-quinone oxidoreductase E subunit